MASLIPEDLSAPGTRALVIGCSAYRHLGDWPEPTVNGSSFELEQLSAAARSTSEFAGWLLTEGQPPWKGLVDDETTYGTTDDGITLTLE